MLGIVDQRVPVTMERYGDDANPALVAETDAYRIYQVRWPVLERVTGEGLLIEPKQEAKGSVVVIPDADETPEMCAGLVAGTRDEVQMARLYAEQGMRVVVLMLIDRSDSAAGDPSIAMTNMPNREWIHRQAFTMGRTIIGFEVQKVLAAVEWLRSRREGIVGISGYGEGGLIALYAGACDESAIKAVEVSGYFKSRQQTWSEPLYRDLWGLLTEFGDAEIATLISPGTLIIDGCPEPKIEGAPPAHAKEKNYAAPGKLTTRTNEEWNAEVERLRTLASPQGFLKIVATWSPDKRTVGALTPALAGTPVATLSKSWPKDQRLSFDPKQRQQRQVHELNDYIQLLVRNSDRVRDAYFLHKVFPDFANVPWNYSSTFPFKDAPAFEKEAKGYKRQFWEDVLGKMDDPLPAPNPRARLIYDKPTWQGWEVVLDTGGESFAWGVLLLPKDIKPGERRPVVVCQHGRHGIPALTIEGDTPAYHDFAARLAERGFITLAPHNLYQKEEAYRTLARKGHAIKATHWSIMLRHHQQWLTWLASLPQVDAKRIGFYGLSFGGESAMRLPSLLDGYALSICSGDFNDWTRKLASTHDRKSFMFSDEWEIGCFNMGSTFSYAELSYLIFPRPFMVERGHHDGVGLDAWVASEYAKTRWFYDQFGLGDRTAIEFFNGGHTINGQGTFEFLHNHLAWPKK